MQEHIFERMARERNISVEEMRAIISDRIEKGWNDKDPVKREQWRKIPCAGEIPTPDEWLSYVIKKIKDDGQGNLLRKYLVWQLHLNAIHQIGEVGQLMQSVAVSGSVCRRSQIFRAYEEKSVKEILL